MVASLRGAGWEGWEGVRLQRSLNFVCKFASMVSSLFFLCERAAGRVDWPCPGLCELAKLVRGLMGCPHRTAGSTEAFLGQSLLHSSSPALAHRPPFWPL